MTDQTIPADDLRRFIARYRAVANDRGSILLDELEALLPAPKHPTLADMSVEERAACQWMQADVKGEESRVVIIVYELSEGRAALLDRWGNVTYEKHGRITPRPDLPRLEWPGDTPTPAPALPDGWRLADHPKHGRVIVTTQTPNDDGRVYFVLPVSRNLMGFDWRACSPDELTYLGQESGPAPATLTEGSEWGDIAALATACRESGRDQITVIDCDGDVFVWSAFAEWWECGCPLAVDAPYTIIHAGKGGDQ